MATHRPIVLQVATSGANPLVETLPFKDGVRMNVSRRMEPVTTGRPGLYRPEEWEHRILGRDGNSGIAVVHWVDRPS